MTISEVGNIISVFNWEADTVVQGTYVMCPRTYSCSMVEPGSQRMHGLTGAGVSALRYCSTWPLL